ncbi:MAG: hypothetical protein IKV13_01290 [Akkermansia sp.]|nr:hypothetical protein [Akkermansia sp.]MBR5330099.1 hypothetical protein [Akkermansia sp.]MEE1266530.1 hypothetical protein [Akkermansia sp.]
MSSNGHRYMLIICGVWLGLHALLHLLLFPFLAYTGLCSLMLPVSLWILSSLTSRVRYYLLLQLPTVLLCVAWWFAEPALGLMSSLQWLPCVLAGCALKPTPDKSWWFRALLYIIALLPFAAMVPLFIFVYQTPHH